MNLKKNINDIFKIFAGSEEAKREYLFLHQLFDFQHNVENIAAKSKYEISTIQNGDFSEFADKLKVELCVEYSPYENVYLSKKHFNKILDGVLKNVRFDEIENVGTEIFREVNKLDPKSTIFANTKAEELFFKAMDVLEENNLKFFREKIKDIETFKNYLNSDEFLQSNEIGPEQRFIARNIIQKIDNSLESVCLQKSISDLVGAVEKEFDTCSKIPFASKFIDLKEVARVLDKNRLNK